MEKNYTLGVIGGMGPMATATFMQIIIENTDATRDQDHLPMLIRHIPYIPDRTSYILDRTKENPMPYILEAALQLQKDGVAEIAVPCVTSHFFHKDIQKELSIPMLNGVEDTAKSLQEMGCSKVGIMATDGTVKSRLFSEALGEYDLECIYPDEKHQKLVMDIIYGQVKSGKSVNEADVKQVLSYLYKLGANAVVLGCTELSLIPKNYLEGETLDVMEVLAKRCLADWKK